MIAEKTNVPDLIEWIDLDKLHVHAPTTVVLVCGGTKNIKIEDPSISFRDGFLKISLRSPLSKSDFRTPEDVTIYGPNRPYNDWMTFEADFAQICQLVMLFCESEGSIAELGTFANIDEIARKLLVLIDEINFKSPSYIKLGPIQAINERYGRSSLFVINYAGLGITHKGGFSGLDLDEFHRRLSAIIPGAIDRHKDPRTFDRARAGHKIKFMTGMIQHFGALTRDEIEFILWCVGIKIDGNEIDKYIECAKIIEWIAEDPRGERTFYTAYQDRDAFEYSLIAKKGVPTISKAAWRAQVRQYWQTNDPDRFASILSVLGGGAV